MDGAKTKTTLLFSLVMIVFFSGCIGTAAQMLYVFRGNKIKAEFDGLKNKRVAIVCVSDASSYGPDALTQTISRALGGKLAMEVKKIHVIPNAQIEEWKDMNGWNEINMHQLGQGVDADAVVAVEISSYSIHEGSTMYKGRSNVTTTVYDIQNGGEVLFVHGPNYFEFPKTHARPVIGTSDAQFEAAYLSKIVENTARLFYDYERLDQFADDATGF